MARWERLVHDRDDKRVWAAIDWRGECIENENAEVKPSNEDSRVHYDEIYYPVGSTTLVPNQCQSDVFIPVLDEPIQVDEVMRQIYNMKPNKSCSPDSVSPGVVKYLPALWILTLTALFDVVLVSKHLPFILADCSSDYFFYKKGDRKKQLITEGLL